ncbi:MAG: TonB-dependent receptor, partial [Candidatus Acidoferrales bacterium]
MQGRHTFKFGAEYKRHRADIRFAVATRGQVNHLGFIPDANGIPNPFTDFLAGLSGLSVMGSGVDERRTRANDFSWFVHHDWRVTNRFSLNLGLRYEYYGPFYETDGRLVGFDPALATTTPIPGLGVALTGGYVQASNAKTPLPGIPMVRKSLVAPDKNNFAPRIGFAFQPFANTDRLVVRGGYGVYYDRPNAQLLLNQLLNFPYHTLALVFATPITDPFVQVPPPSAFPLDVTD